MAAIAYKDNGVDGSNIYIGGSSDTTHINSGDNEEWAPSITLIDKDGQIDKAWQLKLENNFENDRASHTFINHMNLDETRSTSYMFGTTRSADAS